MPNKVSQNEKLRQKDGVIDQRQQQIDPNGAHRTDVNEAAKTSQKQPGHLPRKQKGATDAK